jgi:outer membrane lipoprotein-sorting protein
VRRFFRIRLTAIILALALCALTACDEKEKAILKRMETHSRALQTLRADVTVEIHNAQLDETDVSKGKLIYLLPKRGSDMYLRLDWETPRQESLAVVHKQYVLYRPQLKQAIVGTIDNPKISAMVNDGLAFLNPSQEKLKAEYEIRILGLKEVVGGIKTFHLEFTPKVPKQYKTVELWADYNGMPVVIKIKMKNADTTKISFSNIVKNATVNTSVFKLSLPKDTKIIKQ